MTQGRLLFRWTLPALLIWALITGCGEKSIAEEPKPLGANVDHAQYWADSVFKTLNLRQKAAQLILVAPPQGLDAHGRIAFADSLAANRFGGLVLDVGQRDSLRRLSRACRAQTILPLWIALDAGSTWGDGQNWPSLLSLGTVASDSLSRRWGAALAAECDYLGAQICLVSAAKVAEKGTWTRDALSAAPKIVLRLSNALIGGITDAGIQACARPMRERSDYIAHDTAGTVLAFHETLQELDKGAAMPLQKLIQAQPDVWLQATTATYTALDSLPIDRSARALRFFLRGKLGYGGIVLSPRRGEVAHLQAGADVLVAPRDPFAAVAAIVAAVQSGALRTSWLDSTVHKLLLAKAQRNLDRMPMRQLTAVDPYGDLQRLDRAIGKATMVVLRDTKNRLPLGADVTQARVATVAYGMGHMSDLQSAMLPYAAFENFILNASADSTALAAQVERYKKYDYVIIGLHAPLVKDAADGHLPRRTIHFLEELDRVTKLVVVDFAGRPSLEDLHGLSCLAFVAEDHERMANLAGQAIMGAFPVTAMLPDDISPSFPAGSGKVLPKKLRLEYTDPEDLGITPKAIWRIDSLIEIAIKRGVFPGCQVFAAKDGKVFLHRGYGYHDYSRARTVQTSDLYDIASVSKIASTTLMAMRAYDLDTLRLDQPLKYFMPDLDSSFITIKDITPQQLLTHTAGLPPGIVLNRYFNLIKAPDSIRSKIYSNVPDEAHELRIAQDLYLASSYRDTVWNLVRRIRVGPNGSYEYSDLSMYLMKAVLERMLQKPIEEYVNQEFYAPMGLRRIGYNPLTRFEKDEIVPTAEDKFWRKQVLQGDVHDETVAFLGGVGGPAGIFSTSENLGTLMQMLMNGGSYGGHSYLDPQTVALFTQRQPGSHRGLGFDKQLSVPSCEKGFCCYSADPETFGHIGFTGTCAWADPRNGVVYVFLSNRVYPDARNGKINQYRVRQNVQQLIYDALGIGMPKDGLLVQQEDCYIEGA